MRTLHHRRTRWRGAAVHDVYDAGGGYLWWRSPPSAGLHPLCSHWLRRCRKACPLWLTTPTTRQPERATPTHRTAIRHAPLCFHQEIKAFLSVTFFQPPGCWIPGAVGIIPIDLQTRADSQRWGRGQDWGWWWWWWGG